MAYYLETLNATERTYATVAALMKAVEKVEASSGEKFMITIAAAGPDYKRFTPVFNLSEKQMRMAGGLAGHGFFVCRG
jgi:hypothetical protein